MKKDIVCVEFDNISVSEAQGFFREINDTLRKDYYVIGTFKPYVSIKSVSGNTPILFLEGKHYTAEELISIIKKYEKE